MIRTGDTVTIKPEWQDEPISHPIVALEDQYENWRGEAIVLVQHQIPSMAIWPVERIHVSMLEVA